MASRDLTRKYLERRSRSTRVVEDVENPLASLPPVWVDLVETVETEIAKIERALRELKELHTKRVMVTFDDQEAALDQEIEAKSREATRYFRTCEQTLKKIETEGSDSEMQIRNNVRRSMAMRIQTLNQEFRKTQKQYLGRIQNQDDTFDFLNPNPNEGFNQQQLAAVVDVENLVNERDDEIRKIAESIQELSTIFKELAVLVIDQGTILDRIDFNMEQVAEHTRKGVVEIERAEQYQKAARPRICIALLMLLNALMLILLVLKYQGDNSGKKKK